MKGDFSRLTFDPTKQFSRVRMQQGRVMLDADWNELNDILLHYMRTLGADLIGPHGGPVNNVGFEIEQGDAESGPKIFGGHYYVDGILSALAKQENVDGQPVASANYFRQPYFPINRTDHPLPQTPYLAYLDVWERHVSYLEDALIREVALGGPDTATRAQIIWQVKTMGVNPQDIFDLSDNNPNPACGNLNLEKFRSFLKGNQPTLKARVKKPSNDDTDPCVTSPEARYRGAENQLYRVEVHRVNTDGKATFKWSRENGSVVARWLQTKGSDLIVSGIRDEVKGFQAGDWVELTHDDLELRAEPGVMVQLSKVEGDALTFDSNTASGTVESDPSKLKNPKVRRWDQKQVGEITLEDGTIPVTESDNDWVMLEDGLEIQFQLEGTPHDYRTGDYWLIPARVATGDVEWPGGTDTPDPLPPHGIDHHYAPLAFVNADAITDLRKAFTAFAQCFNLR
ncbi:MAG: DUF6519 domain-containing protein [Trueperaceae bacterium]